MPSSTSSSPRPQPAVRPGKSIGSIDWEAAARHPTLKRVGDELHGPCPVSRDGEDCFWLRPEKTAMGCRRCGDGNGRLPGDSFRAHAEALDAWREPAPKAAARREKWEEAERWTWRSAEGVIRDQIRYKTKDGKTQKRWAVTVPKNTPRPADLLYMPPVDLAGVSGPVLMTEGASDALAARGRGLTAVGRPGAKPSRASLERLPAGLEYWLTPDCDEAGSKQAATWYWGMVAAERTVRVVDMAALRPLDAKQGWDLRDWLSSVPPEADPIALLRAHLRDAEPKETAPPPEAALVERQKIEHGIEGVASAITALKVELRYNTLNGREEFREHGETEWTPRVDGWESSLRARIEKAFEWEIDKTPRPALVGRELFGTAVEKMCYGHRENPMLTWLEQLPPWDGEPRLDNWMERVWDCGRTPEELLAWASRAPLIAAVQRQVKPGAKHDEVVILYGPQGVGKSSAIRALTPNADAWFTDALNLGSDDKQRIESLLGRVVCEISDMQGLRKLGGGGVENLKAFLSRREDGVRLAYRRNPEVFPRMAIIYGTANPNSRGCLLEDESGVRRFVVVEIESRLPVSRVVGWIEENREQLWAEAWSRREEPSFLPGDLVASNETHSGQHQPQDEAAETLVESLLEQAPAEGFGLLALLDEVLPSDSQEKRREFCNVRGARRLGGILRRHGYDLRPVRVEGKLRKLWVPVDEHGRIIRGAPPPEPEPEPEPEHPTCEVCGAVFLAGPDGVTNRCYSHRGEGG